MIEKKKKRNVVFLNKFIIAKMKAKGRFSGNFFFNGKVTKDK